MSADQQWIACSHGPERTTQLLYALNKHIQWQCPECGEDKFVVTFGGLHIEMVALRSAGTILRGSRWTSAFSEAGVASSGTAESYLWIASGQGKNTRWISVHQLVKNMGTSRSSGMPFFQAFIHCEVVFAFEGKGEKTAWQTWYIFEDISSTFAKLSQSPLTFDDTDLPILEKLW